jgi:UDP-N-acetyl-D-mannosaminuronic acid transferase (WecB/TagA/CpsF family)
MGGEYFLHQLKDEANTGFVFGKTSSDKIAFYGGTPASRPSAPTAVATTVSISTTSAKWGYSTSTQANAIVTAVNTLIGIVTSLGLAA